MENGIGVTYAAQLETPLAASGGVFRSNGEVAGGGKDRHPTKQQRRCCTHKAPIQLSARKVVHGSLLGVCSYRRRRRAVITPIKKAAARACRGACRAHRLIVSRGMPGS